jgi:hypothetical protein
MKVLAPAIHIIWQSEIVVVKLKILMILTVLNIDTVGKV